MALTQSPSPLGDATDVASTTEAHRVNPVIQANVRSDVEIDALYPYRISQPVSKTWRPRLSSEPGTAEVYFWVKEMTDRSQPAVDHFREGADLQPDGFSVPSYS